MKNALKEIFFFKKKYFLIEGLVILMIFMVMFLSGLTNGLERIVSSAIETMDASYFVLDEDAEGNVPYSMLTDEQVTAVEDLSVDDLSELNIQRSTFTTDELKDSQDIHYFAVEEDSKLLPEIIEGDGLSGKEGQIVLNNTFKDDGIEIGDTLTDSNGETTLTVVGFTKDAMYGHGPVGFISQETYTAIFQEENPQYTFRPQAFATDDKAVLDEKVDGTEVFEKQALIEKIPGYSAEQSTLQMITWVLVVASAAILAVFFYIISMDKRHQFGVMKALGMGMGTISFQQIAQVLLLATFGVIIGDLLTIGMASLLPAAMPFHLDMKDMLLISAAFIVITVLASLLSIRRIAKIDPIEIINGGES